MLLKLFCWTVYFLAIICLLCNLKAHSAETPDIKKYEATVSFKDPVSKIHIELDDTGVGKYLIVCDDNNCQRIILLPINEDK